MDFNRKMVTTSPQETARLGEELGDWIRKKHVLSEVEGAKGKRQKGRGVSRSTVICLYGELGSGKTTLVQGFAKALGVTSRLLSPTFIIVRRYQMLHDSGCLYHIDLYRVDGEKDLLGLGIQEILADPDSVVLIEWAEKLGGLLPKRRIDIRFIVLPDDTHQITIAKLT